MRFCSMEAELTSIKTSLLSIYESCIIQWQAGQQKGLEEKEKNGGKNTQLAFGCVKCFVGGRSRESAFQSNYAAYIRHDHKKETTVLLT